MMFFQKRTTDWFEFADLRFTFCFFEGKHTPQKPHIHYCRWFPDTPNSPSGIFEDHNNVCYTTYPADASAATPEPPILPIRVFHRPQSAHPVSKHRNLQGKRQEGDRWNAFPDSGLILNRMVPALFRVFRCWDQNDRSHHLQRRACHIPTKTRHPEGGLCFEHTRNTPMRQPITCTTIGRHSTNGTCSKVVASYLGEPASEGCLCMNYTLTNVTNGGLAIGDLLYNVSKRFWTFRLINDKP